MAGEDIQREHRKQVEETVSAKRRERARQYDEDRRRWAAWAGDKPSASLHLDFVLAPGEAAKR